MRINNNFFKCLILIFLFGCSKREKKVEKKIIESPEIAKDSGLEAAKEAVIELEDSFAEIEMNTENFENDDYNNVNLNQNLNIQSNVIEKMINHEVKTCYNFKLSYDYDVYILSEENILTLKKIVEILNNEKSLKVEIISSASASEDLFISSNRLSEVIKFFIEAKLNENRIYSKKDLNNNSNEKEENERYVIINLVKTSDLTNEFSEFCYN